MAAGKRLYLLTERSRWGMISMGDHEIEIYMYFPGTGARLWHNASSVCHGAVRQRQADSTLVQHPGAGLV